MRPTNGSSASRAKASLVISAGAANQRELVLVLDGAQRLDHAAPRDELEPAGLERLVGGVGHGVRLEGEPAGKLLGQPAVQVPLRDRELDVRHALAGLRIAEVAEEPSAARLDQQRRVRAVEPGQVADVDRGGDEERLLDPLLQLLEPVIAASFRYSSASR